MMWRRLLRTPGPVGPVGPAGALLAAIAVLAAFVLPAAVAQAQGGPVFTEYYLLQSGERADGLFVAGRTITLDAGSHVTGDALLIADVITLRGDISGEVVALGRSIVLDEEASIGGDAALCAQAITDHGALIEGELSRNCEGMGAALGGILPPSFDPTRRDWGDFDLNAFLEEHLGENSLDLSLGGTPLQRFGAGIGISLLAAALSALTMIVIPYRVRRVSDALLAAPVPTLVVGLATMLAAGAVTGLVIISLVLVVTFCLVPVVGLGGIGLALLAVLGWSGMGLPVGVWLMHQANVRRFNPIVVASLGSFALTFAVHLLAISAWTLALYLLVGLGLTSWGLGAAVLTRGGGQRYPIPIRSVSARRDSGEAPAQAR